LRVLKKKDLWYSVVGGAALATGGGGAPATYDQFNEVIDPIIENGGKLRLINTFSIPDDELIFINAGVG